MSRKFIVCDNKGSAGYELDVDELTLLFLDTLLAQLNAGTTEASEEFGYADYFECMSNLFKLKHFIFKMKTRMKIKWRCGRTKNSMQCCFRATRPNQFESF